MNYDDETLIAEHAEQEKRRISQHQDYLFTKCIIVCLWLLVAAFLVGVIANVSQQEGGLLAIITLTVVVTIILSTWYRVTWT